MQFEHDYITQEKWLHQLYIDSLLAEHELASCNSVVTPVNSSHPLGRDSDTYPAAENLTCA